MHVVEVPDPKEFGKQNAKETGLFVGVNKIVMTFSQQTKGLG
jgi:hypothetical protein